MLSTVSSDKPITVRLRAITDELRQLQELLMSGEELDARILTDFRDAVNRVRNAAWALQQYANSKATESNPTAVFSMLAGERVRVAYQICKLVQADVANPEIQLQKGQLLRLRDVLRELCDQLGGTVRE